MLRDVFSGDLAKVFKAVPEFEKGAEDGEGGEAPVEAEITELDRLAYVVHRIDHECAVVPRGAVQLTAAKEVVPAKNFTGAGVVDCREETHDISVDMETSHAGAR